MEFAGVKALQARFPESEYPLRAYEERRLKNRVTVFSIEFWLDPFDNKGKKSVSAVLIRAPNKQEVVLVHVFPGNKEEAKISVKFGSEPWVETVADEGLYAQPQWPVLASRGISQKEFLETKALPWKMGLPPSIKRRG